MFPPIKQEMGLLTHKSGMICVGVLIALILTEKRLEIPFPLSLVLSLSVEVNREWFEFINMKKQCMFHLGNIIYVDIIAIYLISDSYIYY